MANSILEDRPVARLLTQLHAELDAAITARDATEEDEAEFEAQDAAWDCVRAMSEQPAATLADLRIKARALRFAFEDELQSAGSDAAPLASLLDDIEPLAVAS